MLSYQMLRLITRALALGLLLALLPTADLMAADPTQRSELDLPALEARLDAFMAEMMTEYHVPGAAVAVVVADRLALSKGYGVSDLERRTPVDPEHTLSRIGSVTKLFTATAVMQLIERGQLGLDDEVNARISNTPSCRQPTHSQ